MKIIDKLLKILKTDRNTFFTYILTVFTIYFAVDRLIEIMLMIITGVSATYWGPIQYTFALACPIFAFLFSCSSSFVKNDDMKISFLYLYIIALYIIGVSMAVQWINLICWLLLISAPGYVTVVTEFSNLIRPAFQSLAVYLPLTTFYPLMRWIILTVNDNLNIIKSIREYTGINLSQKKEGVGAYSCEMPLHLDKITGDKVVIPEGGRFQSTFICGISGSGKTSMLFEPMMAKDLEKKFFFKEASKELGYTALKTRIATLNSPYDNDYLNKNFNLNMLTPSYGKEKVFKAFLSKMIIGTGNNIVYKDLGLTSISPDYESTSRILEVANNFNIPVNIIDPNNSNSIGLNPFTFEDPIKIAIIISSVLKEMYTRAGTDIEESFKQNAALQAVENLCILLKEMYPRLNNGDLPNLEDMLNMFNDFSLVEDMCKQLEIDEELARKYNIQLGYFKKNFYANGINRNETEKNIQVAASQLDVLLRVPGVRNILCNRTNNLNYDNVLANGEITLVCTRRGDLGASVHTAFGLFFLLLMQYSVLRRPGNENTRIPHFLYIDEFSDFITHATTNMFTLYRKYKVGIIISAQNLRQLGEESRSRYRETILSNCYNKFVFGNNSVEDNEWWSKEIGEIREWKFTHTYNTEEVKYKSDYGSAELKYKVRFTPGKIQGLGAKICAYKIKNTKGKFSSGQMKVDFLASKYFEPQTSKKYNFNKFTGTVENQDSEEVNKKQKFDLKSIKFDSDDNGEVDPIRNNTTDSKFLFATANSLFVSKIDFNNSISLSFLFIIILQSFNL